MTRATKKGGFIYTSFKYGNFQGYRKERYFTDFTEERFAAFINNFRELSIIEMWVSHDVRPDRGKEKWLNIILKRSDTGKGMVPKMSAKLLTYSHQRSRNA